MKTLILMALIFGMSEASFAKALCNSGDLQKDISQIFEAREQEKLSDQTVQYLIDQSKRAKMSEIFACTVNCNRVISQPEYEFAIAEMTSEVQAEVADLVAKQRKYIELLRSPGLSDLEKETYTLAVDNTPTEIQALKERFDHSSQNIKACTQ